jgi:hypothetical protein
VQNSEVMDDSAAPQDERRAVELIEGGSEIAGAVTGAAIGLIAGPPGAIAGSAAGVIVTRGLKRVGAEVGQRWLSPRQQVRVGAGLAFALARIRERLSAGDSIRSDGFFESRPGHRSNAEELLEGVLLQVANSYEEARIQYIGRLYASIVFETVDPAYGHFLVRMTERLSFRQLVCLSLIANGVDRDLLLAADAPAADAYYFSDDVAVELDELATLGLAGVGQPGGRVVDPRTGRFGRSDGFRSVVLGDAALSVHGRRLAELMELRDVPDDARRDVARHLWAITRAE